jgi:hypothetical protein
MAGPPSDDRFHLHLHQALQIQMCCHNRGLSHMRVYGAACNSVTYNTALKWGGLKLIKTEFILYNKEDLNRDPKVKLSPA